MKLLVDGYNLLHASGVFGLPSDPPTLETARRALLEFLAAHLSERERALATIVFDGKDAPPGLPAESVHDKLSVVFSRRKTTADELIGEMIADEPDPKHLLVVSSDHGVQRSARQRGCHFQDSEAWCREVRERSAAAETATADKPEHVQTADEVRHWLREFSPPSPRPAPHATKPANQKSRDQS